MKLSPKEHREMIQYLRKAPVWALRRWKNLPNQERWVRIALRRKRA